MRRMLSILPILTLVVGATALPGCSSGMRNECPTMCQPDCVHETSRPRFLRTLSADGSGHKCSGRKTLGQKRDIPPPLHYNVCVRDLN